MLLYDWLRQASGYGRPNGFGRERREDAVHNARGHVQIDDSVGVFAAQPSRLYQQPGLVASAGVVRQPAGPHWERRSPLLQLRQGALRLRLQGGQEGKTRRRDNLVPSLIRPPRLFPLICLTGGRSHKTSRQEDV